MPSRRRQPQDSDSVWSAAITSMDAQIRAGQGATVRAEIVRLVKDVPPRAALAELAWISWRVGVPDIGVKLLNPVVRPKSRSPLSATDREKAEYASCLVRIGAVDEALAILSSVSKKEFPRAALYEVFGLVAEWRYAETVPLLHQFLKTRPSDYDALVANVNLAAALVVLRRDAEALTLLDALERQTEKEKHLLLLGNVRELRAATHVRMHRWAEARKACEHAGERLRDHGGVFALILDKWVAVAEAGLSSTKQPGKLLEPIKARARALEHWETVRDCERFEFLLSGNPELFSKLYFGTPFPEFRQSLKLEMTVPFPIPASYEWKLGETATNVVDLTTTIAGAKVGQQNHRVLVALASDFYRPFRTAQLHSRLFPGEFYNPVSAPHRVAEAIHRTKAWLDERGLPISIAHSDAGYHLTALDGGVRIRVALEVPTNEDRDWKAMQSAFDDRPFSISEAVARLGHPRRTTARLLQHWTESGQLTKSGAGRITRYTINKN